MITSSRPAQQRKPGTFQLRIWRQRIANLAPKTLALLLQGIFCAVVLVPVVLLWFSHREGIRIPELTAGIALLLVPTVLVALTPVAMVHQLRWPSLLLPLTDLAGLGVIRWATLPDGAQLSSLALAPALWLVVQYRMRGVLLGTIAILLTISLPSLAADTVLSVADFARFAVLPITFLIVAALVLILFARLSHQHKELKRQDRLLKGVINHLNVGVLVMDAQGNDVMANPAQRYIHGLVSPEGNPDPTEAGHLIYDIDGASIPPQHRPARRVIRGESFDDVLIVAGSPTDEQRVLEVTSRIIASPDDGVESRILIFDDISDAYHEQRAQQDIIATVSHELRTPLTSILGYTDFAIETLHNVAEDDRRELEVFLTVIERNAEKLLARVEDLLLQQQSRYGNLKLNKQLLCLSALAREAVQAQQALAVERNISLELDTVHEPIIRADAQRINQVMDNLLSNALKFTPPGGRVQVRVDRDDGDGVSVPEAIFAVTDSGPGMSPKELESLFTPFYRTQSAATSTQGTGLGLSVSKGIVETHHGSIQVDSTVGEGSTFVVRLPLHEEYTS